VTHFVHTQAGYVNLTHVVKVSAAGHLTLTDGSVQQVSSFCAEDLFETLLTGPSRIVPAAPGYAIVGVYDDGKETENLSPVPIVAWRGRLSASTSDLVEPIGDDGWAMESDAECERAILRPDGSVYNLSGDRWLSVDLFHKAALARLRDRREKPKAAA
jgi:hypothetical protein